MSRLRVVEHRSQRRLQALDVVAIWRDEQVEVLGRTRQPVERERDRTEDHVLVFSFERGKDLSDEIDVHANDQAYAHPDDRANVGSYVDHSATEESG